jgi:uncharacterized protein YbcI
MTGVRGWSSLRGGELGACVSDTSSAEIARECARIQTRFLGRGPAKTRVFSRADLLVVLMEDTLTTADKSLLAHGKDSVVEHVRAEFQDAMEQEFVSAIERLTSRTVVAFMSGSHIDPDMAVEVFVLTPDGESAELD